MCEAENIGSFVERDSEMIKIIVNGNEEIWSNLKFFEFESVRKLMTRVVRNEATGQILVLTKGADTSVISRCIVNNS